MKRLLVIRFSALGDVAMVVPVVRALAEQYPELEITMLSQQRMADLFAGLPKNVRFHGVNLQTQSLREMIAGLGTYDYVADLHGVWRSMVIRWAMRLRGANVKTIQKGRFSRFLLTHKISRKPLKNTILRYCDTFKRLGFILDTPHVPLSTAGKGIGIAPFAAHTGKVYPLERMERVVELLSQQGERIVLFGAGSKEQEILEAWSKNYPNVESVAGRYSLGEELEMMRGLRVMLSMDSANMHLASLVGTRVVSVWGATHPWAGFVGMGQRESDCIQRKDLPCRPCSIYGNKKCTFGDYRCMDISPEEIVQRISIA
ncbi:MAG: glycosyltransferase family 9 protein [Paludibacteraceae bacterium]|nr:glycosyltransferase family 9 protein [Paludibacteraceae bacterium]